MIESNDKHDYLCTCDKGHEWQVRPHNRTINNTGCPYCNGRFAIKGENDLETLYPDIAEEWHPTKNRKLKPSDVKAKTSTKACWLCPTCGDEWRAVVSSRTAVGTVCLVAQER